MKSFCHAKMCSVFCDVGALSRKRRTLNIEVLSNSDLSRVYID